MTMQFASCRVTVYPGQGDTVIYAPLAPDEAERLLPLLQGRPSLAALHHLDWNRVLTPWPAPRAFRGGEDFAGEAEGFVQEITRDILPAVEKALPVSPRQRIIVGYSLGGLFAVYAALRSGAFHRAGSMSGSLWYDDFIPWVEGHAAQAPARLYLSVGDREKKTRNPRMAPVEDCTRQAADILRRAGAQVRFELNPGGHFDQVTERIAQGINALMDAEDTGEE